MYPRRQWTSGEGWRDNSRQQKRLPSCLEVLLLVANGDLWQHAGVDATSLFSLWISAASMQTAAVTVSSPRQRSAFSFPCRRVAVRWQHTRSSNCANGLHNHERRSTTGGGRRNDCNLTRNPWKNGAAPAVTGHVLRHNSGGTSRT